MKKIILVLSTIMSLLSCQKEDNPNYDGPILLSKTIQVDNQTTSYTYDAEDYLTKAIHRLPNGDVYRIDYHYNELNKLIKQSVYDVINKAYGFYDTIIYKDDYSSYTYQPYWGFWGTERHHYYNSNGEIYYSNYGNYMTVKEYKEPNLLIEKYFNTDSTYLGEIKYTLDDQHNPSNPFPYLHGAFSHNVRSMNSDSVDEKGNIDFGVFPNFLDFSESRPYTCTYQYNKQGYPVIKSQWINGLDNAEITHYEYIPAK